MSKKRKHYLKSLEFPLTACGEKITAETDFTMLLRGVRCPECRAKRLFPHCYECRRHGHHGQQCDLRGWRRDQRSYERRLIRDRKQKKPSAWCVHDGSLWHATPHPWAPVFTCRFICSDKRVRPVSAMDYRKPTCPNCRFRLLHPRPEKPEPRFVKMHRTRPARIQGDPEPGDNSDGGDS